MAIDYDLRKLHKEFDEFKREVSDRLNALEEPNRPAPQQNETVTAPKFAGKRKNRRSG